METGIHAWIANYEFNTSGSNGRIDLPNGWYWDIAPDKTGYLKNPEGQCCVGYDLDIDAIRFGAGGATIAPGLNLWTVQEMGEKFAREYFMDEAAGEEYDAFAKKRSESRREYEKQVRGELAGIIQLEVSEGKWTAHVATNAVEKMTGIKTKPELTREEGLALFNEMSEKRHTMPLRDPMGYMTLDHNMYDYIKDQYEFQYDDMIQNIDNGFINGSGRGCEAVLDKLDAVVRKDMRKNCLPDGVNYQDLRFMSVTEDMANAVNEFVKQRVTRTVNYEKKRSHSAESLQRDNEKFLAASEALKEQIANAGLPPMDVPLEASDGIVK